MIVLNNKYNGALVHLTKTYTLDDDVNLKAFIEIYERIVLESIENSGKSITLTSSWCPHARNYCDVYFPILLLFIQLSKKYRDSGVNSAAAINATLQDKGRKCLNDMIDTLSGERSTHSPTKSIDSGFGVTPNYHNEGYENKMKCARGSYDVSDHPSYGKVLYALVRYSWVEKISKANYEFYNHHQIGIFIVEVHKETKKPCFRFHMYNTNDEPTDNDIDVDSPFWLSYVIFNKEMFPFVELTILDKWLARSKACADSMSRLFSTFGFRRSINSKYDYSGSLIDAFDIYYPSAGHINNIMAVTTTPGIDGTARVAASRKRSISGVSKAASKSKVSKATYDTFKCNFCKRVVVTEQGCITHAYHFPKCRRRFGVLPLIQSYDVIQHHFSPEVEYNLKSTSCDTRDDDEEDDENNNFLSVVTALPGLFLKATSNVLAAVDDFTIKRSKKNDD